MSLPLGERIKQRIIDWLSDAPEPDAIELQFYRDWSGCCIPESMPTPDSHTLRQCPHCHVTCEHKVLNESYHCGNCGIHYGIARGTTSTSFDIFWELQGARYIEGTTEAAARQVWDAALKLGLSADREHTLHHAHD